MLWILTLIALLFGAGSALAQGGLPKAFYGMWNGVSLTSSGAEGLELSPADLDVEIEPAGDGFQMSWTSLTHTEHDDKHSGLVRQPVDARFTPTDRPGVFAFDPADSSILLGLFGDPATNNPLEGEPLLWARVEGDTLSVYGLVIGSDGDFDLYQHVRTLTDDGMIAVHTHRTEHEPAVELEGRLERDGG